MHIDYIPGSTYVAFDRANDRQTEAMTEEVIILELEPLGPVTAKGPQHARFASNSSTTTQNNGTANRSG